jgi:hypothetical protein
MIVPRTLVMSLLLGLALPGCRHGAEAGGTSAPGGSAASGVSASVRDVSRDDVIAVCGGVRFPRLPPDPSLFEPFREWSDVDMSVIDGERGFFDQYDWSVAEETSKTLQLFGQPKDGVTADPLYASAGFQSEGGVWKPQGWGDCRVELTAEGWGTARFTLDPSQPATADSSTVAVMATEVNCAGGSAPDGRDVQAVVVDETPDAVFVLILVEPVKGGATCPGNPAFPFIVDLGSPVGGREVFDASLYPPVDRSQEAGASGSTA